MIGLAMAAILTLVQTPEGPPTKTVTALYGPITVEVLASTDPISARMDSDVTIRVAGPIGLKVDAHDLPVIGKKHVDGKLLWAVQFGAKNAYVVLVDDDGTIFSLDSKTGKLGPDDRIRPRDAKITPLPR